MAYNKCYLDFVKDLGVSFFASLVTFSISAGPYISKNSCTFRKPPPTLTIGLCIRVTDYLIIL